MSTELEASETALPSPAADQPPPEAAFEEPSLAPQAPRKGTRKKAAGQMPLSTRGRTPGAVNKSQAIRDYLTEHPEARPQEIMAALAEQGVDVSPQMVSTIKTKFKSGGRGPGRKKATKRPTPGRPPATGKRRGRPPGTRSSATQPAPPAGQFTIDQLLMAKQLVEEIGDLDQARRALDILEQLQ